VVEENSGEEKRRLLGVTRRKKRQSSRGEGGSVGFCSSARLVEEREREREGGRSRPSPGRRAARWWPAVLGEAVARERQDNKARLERRARLG
jgi:hypothetical protein